MKKPTKKQIKLLVGAIVTIASIVAGLLNSSCATLRERSIVDDVETAVEVAEKIETVCVAAENLGVRDAENCVRVVSKLNGVDMVAVYDAAECIDSYAGDIEGIDAQKCFDAVAGWKDLVEKLRE